VAVAVVLLWCCCGGSSCGCGGGGGGGGDEDALQAEGAEIDLLLSFSLFSLCCCYALS
jgi:hypothetical protein